MTIFLGVDPGKTIGVAWWRPQKQEWNAYQTKDPYEAMKWFNNVLDHTPRDYFEVTVEKYAGGGYKTADGIYTTELVGWFTHHFTFWYKKEVRNPISQQRLSGMGKVRELIGSTPVEGPHSHDALAHAIVHARSLGW